MDIMGVAGMSPQEITFEINRGSKFVCYRYCISVGVLTLMPSTNPYFVRAGENRIVKGLRWSVLTLLLGWWGIPWGPIRTVHSVWINFHGGDDVTAAVAGAIGLQDVNWDVAGASKT